MPEVMPVPPAPAPRRRRWAWLLLVVLAVAAVAAAYLLTRRPAEPAQPSPEPASPLATPSCQDTDGARRPNDIYLSGRVTFTDEAGQEQTIDDACSPDGRTLTEGWCYETDAGSNVFTGGALEYECPNGCDEGACRPPAG